MSYFSTAFRAALDFTGMTQREFSSASGIGPSPLSRYVSGAAPVGPDVLAKILGSLPRARAGECLAAWLRDSVPSECADLVRIEPTNGSGNSVLPIVGDEGLRDLLSWLAQKAVAHKEMRDLLEAVRNLQELT